MAQYKGSVVIDTVAQMVALGSKWAYSYTMTEPAAIKAAGYTTYKMIYGKTELNALEASATTETVLLFNEPNLPDQANMTLREVTDGIKHVKDLWPNAKLVSPTIFGRGDLKTFNYTYVDMVKDYKLKYGVYPPFDYIGMHAYGYYCSDITKYVDWIKSKMSLYGYRYKKYWLTECGVWYPANAYLMRNLALNLKYSLRNRATWIERYAWFPAIKYSGGETTWNACSLFESDGSTLTVLGKEYVKY